MMQPEWLWFALSFNFLGRPFLNPLILWGGFHGWDQWTWSGGRAPFPCWTLSLRGCGGVLFWAGPLQCWICSCGHGGHINCQRQALMHGWCFFPIWSPVLVYLFCSFLSDIAFLGTTALLDLGYSLPEPFSFNHQLFFFLLQGSQCPLLLHAMWSDLCPLSVPDASPVLSALHPSTVSWDFWG